MGFIDEIKAKAKSCKKTIVLPESEDIRTYEAAEAILKEGTANLILIGSEEEIAKNKGDFDITGATIVDPATYEKTDEYVATLVELRKKKGMTEEQAREILLTNYLYYGVMMVKMKDAKDQTKDKNVAFTGGIASMAGKTALKDGGISKVLKIFEFNGASMSVPAMLTLLFGFCLPPRYINAKSDKERKEILVRDISSFTAILFGAKALSRGFSDVFANASGFALNIKPENHNKNFFNKLKNYFTAGSGVNVLNSEQIVSKYSNVQEYQNGINGFFNFLEENGGNVKKVLLNVDKTVKENAEEIMKNFNGQSIKDATIEDIHKAFEKAKGSEALEKIYTVFSTKDNKFVNRAKTMNSAFGFASTLILVPAFMMWLARYCENMTKKAIAKEKEEKDKAAAVNTVAPAAPQPAATTANTTAIANTSTVSESPIIATNKPSMAGFLNK